MKLLLIIFSFLFCLTACVSTKQKSSNQIIGKWDNRSGQIMEFKADGNMLWIFYSASKRDTFEIKYLTDFSSEPKQIDLTGFAAGPLKGKTLYGIIEFIPQHAIKLDFEPSKEKRPKEFNPEQTQTYYRIL